MLFTIPIPPAIQQTPIHATTTVPMVPFYSQFRDIASASWQKVGCGITSLAMILDYYKPAVSVNTLLKQGIAADAYSAAGWTYNGLISVSKNMVSTAQATTSQRQLLRTPLHNLKHISTTALLSHRYTISLTQKALSPTWW
ncbi:MAG: C39 family peptidase [Candidatus Adlerbacteria bacterium]|nr:C39 family peptidase [Candidatus Adlerbacteria bacterium]